MRAYDSLEKAKEAIESFPGEASDFELPIADSLIDPMGFHMAILTDSILGKGWEPDGFEQFPGYRVYKYKSSD